MIGIFKPYRKKHSKTNYLYSSVYCSICLALKRKYGVFFTIFICHEIVQLVVSLLQYCSGICVSNSKCILCWKRKNKEILSHEIINKSADCCLILVWFKIIDSKQDKEHFVYQMLYYVLKNKILNLCSNSINTSEMIEKYIFSMNSKDFDEVIKCTQDAAISIYEVLINSTDLIMISEDDKKRLSSIASLYGKIITIADPLIDYYDDMRKKKTNPISQDTFMYYFSVLENTIKQGRLMVTEFTNNKIVSTYFLNVFLLSCKNIEDKIQQQYNAFLKSNLK